MRNFISRRRVATIRRLLLARPYLWAVGVFFLAFMVRVQNISFRSIWMDEDSQARVAASPLLKIAHRAGAHHQPPIDYYAEKIGLAMFGYTEVGARIHAVVWSAAAAGLFFLLLLRIVRHPLAVGIGTLVFVLQPDIVRYAVEGRPISCGLFFATLYLFAMHFYCSSARRHSSLRRWIAVTTAAYGFLLSVGFQPIVFIIAMCLGLAPGLIRPAQRKPVLFFFGAMLTAGLVAFPTLWTGISKGEAYLGAPLLSERISAMTDALCAVDISGFGQKLAPFMTDCLPLVGAMLPFAVLGWKRGRQKNRQRPRLLIAFLIAAILYPVVFDTLFNGLINYRIQIRYYLTFAPLLILLSTVIIDEGVCCLAGAVSRRSSRLIRGTLLVFVLLGALCLNHLLDGVAERSKTSIRTDWRSLYGLLKRAPKGARAYLFNLVPADRWAPPRFYAARFYYLDDPAPRTRLQLDEHLLIHYRRAERRWRSDIFIVVPYGYAGIRPELFSGMEHVATFRFNLLSVIRIEAGGRMKRRVRALFERMAARLPKSERHYKVFETLGWMRLFDGETEGAREMIRRLEQIDTRGVLAETCIAPLAAGVAEMQ